MNPATLPDGVPFVVGLTGGIGSGKTMVANLFAARGAAIIDTDLIAHQLTDSNGAAIPAIRAAFGEHFITSQGAMDRPRMRDVVFADPAAKKQLEAILHPMIRQQCQHQAAIAKGPYVMMVVPLLIESQTWRTKVARILVVDCPETLQIKRVMERNGLRREQVLAIMANQASRQERLAAADDILSNDGSVEQLAPEIERLHHLYSALSMTDGTIDGTKPA